jgi:hypothetical protein
MLQRITCTVSFASTHAPTLYYKTFKKSIGKTQKVRENFTFFTIFLAEMTQSRKKRLI